MIVWMHLFSSCIHFVSGCIASAGGMPDLLLWNVNTCKAKLSEVKGPRDRLSEQQRAWINALIDAEVDVEVFIVIEPSQGSAPKRRRKW